MPKSLEDLTKQVLDTQAGLMSVEDLKVLFEDVPTAPSPTPQATVEPGTAPAPQAPSGTPAIAEPVAVKPNILELVPEKFRSGDEKTSIEKIVKSYAELESELNKNKREKEELERLVSSLSTPQQVVEPVPSVPDAGVEEDDDSVFFEKPSASSRTIARQEAARVLLTYHNALQEAQKRVAFVENFKASHSDFETYKEDVAFILRSRPDLDKNYTMLPVVYEMAKQRYATKVEKLKATLGLQNQPAPTPQPSPPPVDEAAIVERVKTLLADEIKKRRVASGIQGGSTPISPADRSNTAAKTVPQTPEDAIFEEMLQAGPAKLKLEL